MKQVLFFLVLAVAGAQVARAQDPQISSPSVMPSPGLVNGAVTLSVDFFNASSVAITNPDPVNGPTQITFSCIKFAPTGGATPAVTGPGAVYFDWTAIGSGGTWSIIGKQKAGVTIPGSSGFPPTYAGGKINIPGTITAASTAAQAAMNNGDGFNANIIPGDGGDINTGSGSNNQSSYGYTSGILPLTLLDFTASKNGVRAELVWHTATEQHMSGFTIERSSTGVSFTGIGDVAAAGNSNSTRQYGYTDAVPLAGNNYYRLKMKDAGGTFTYSDIRVLNFDANSTISIFPVPVNDYLTVRGISQPAQITVTAANGQRVLAQESHSAVEHINTKAWASGVYVIAVSREGKVVYSQQFNKAK